MIVPYCTQQIQDSPFREAAIHGRQHKKQLSLGDALDETVIEKERS